jgi:hypothetical protein
MPANLKLEISQEIRRGLLNDQDEKDRMGGFKSAFSAAGRAITPQHADTILRSAEVILPHYEDENYRASNILLEGVDTIAKKHGAKCTHSYKPSTMSGARLKNSAFITPDGIIETAIEFYKWIYEFRDIAAFLAFAKLASVTMLAWQKNQNTRVIEVQVGNRKINVSNRKDLRLAVACLERFSRQSRKRAPKKKRGRISQAKKRKTG